MCRSGVTYWGKMFSKPHFGAPSFWCINSSFCSPDSVRVVSEGLILPLPEDLRIRNACDAALQTHGMTLCDARVLQLLDERRGLVHLFGYGERRCNLDALRDNYRCKQILKDTKEWFCCRAAIYRSYPQFTLLVFPFTCNNEFQVERVLAGSVAGDAGVDARITAGHGLDDQWVHAVFPHQHLMGRIGADRLSVQLPDEVRSGKAAHLQAGKRTEDRPCECFWDLCLYLLETRVY